MLRRALLAPLAGGLLMLAGVVAPGAATADQVLAQTPPDGIGLVVHNDNFADMRVYAVRGTTWWRVGTVTGLTTARLAIPRFLTDRIDDVGIVAVPIGGGQRAVAGPVFAQAGDEIVFRIQASASLSSVRVQSAGS